MVASVRLRVFAHSFGLVVESAVQSADEAATGRPTINPVIGSRPPPFACECEPIHDRNLPVQLWKHPVREVSGRHSEYAEKPLGIGMIK